MFHSVTTSIAPPTVQEDMDNKPLQHQRSHGLLSSILLLRKKQSKISLRSCIKLKTSHSMSTTSLPITMTSTLSTTTSSSSTNEEEEVEETSSSDKKEDIEEPPKYDDNLHPFDIQYPKLTKKTFIPPREEEGNEILPDYHCSLDRLAWMNVKREYVLPNLKSTSRSWIFYYIRVFGTMILAYEQNPDKYPHRKPIWKYSMHNAQVSVASDYFKDKFVLRLKIENGPQFLFKAGTEKNKRSWIATLESSINISSDLDTRRMPQFITVVNRANRINANASRQVEGGQESLL